MKKSGVIAGVVAVFIVGVVIGVGIPNVRAQKEFSFAATGMSTVKLGSTTLRVLRFEDSDYKVVCYSIGGLGGPVSCVKR